MTVGKNGGILMIEDNPGDAALLKAAVEEVKPGCPVVHCGRGQDALDGLRGGLRPDLIVLDMGLPDMRGLEVLQAIRNDPQLAQIPVVVFSLNTPADTGSDYAARANAYVPKPETYDALKDAVRTMLHIWVDRLQSR